MQPVLVQNIALSWGNERIIDVIYDHSYCNGDEVQSAGCSFLLRFVDDQRKIIPQVQFTPPIGKSRIVQSDSYGRIAMLLGPSEVLVFTASSLGHQPEKVELKCGASTSKQELLITLHGIR